MNSGRHILLVEDNADVRETLQELLECLGHRVDVAEDGALGLAAALRDHPEVALVDLGLPELDGYEVARRIRSAEQESAVPRRLFLVALSGYGRPEDRRRALEAGFDLHMVKPPDPDALVAMLARVPA